MQTYAMWRGTIDCATIPQPHASTGSIRCKRCSRGYCPTLVAVWNRETNAERAGIESVGGDNVEGKKLSVGVKLGYGVCDLGGNLYFTVVAFWLLYFLTDTVGLSAALAGGIVIIGKVWDAVTDPMVGFLSDRTTSRWGRRRPYLLFGAVPLFVAMIIMFTNPRISSQAWLFVWGVGAFCLLSTVYTIVNIPYSSLTPELTKDFHEKTSLNGYRFGFAVLGTLLGAGATLPIINAMGNENLGFTVVGAVFGAAMMITALITFFSVREPIRASAPAPQKFFASYGKVLRNRPYRKILFTYTAHMVGISIVSGIMAYYYKYVFGNEDLTTIGLMLLLVTAMLFIPVSVLVSKRIGKKRTYIIGLIIVATVALVVAFTGHLIGYVYTYVMMAIGGVGLGALYALPWAMMPDSIEWDYVRSGTRADGAYYGIWTFFSKIGQAIAIGVTALILQLTGYIADAVQGPSALLGIRIILGPITAIALIAGAIILSRYPMDEAAYQDILARTKEMERPESNS